MQAPEARTLPATDVTDPYQLSKQLRCQVKQFIFVYPRINYQIYQWTTSDKRSLPMPAIKSEAHDSRHSQNTQPHPVTLIGLLSEPDWQNICFAWTGTPTTPRRCLPTVPIHPTTLHKIINTACSCRHNQELNTGNDRTPNVCFLFTMTSLTIMTR